MNKRNGMVLSFVFACNLLQWYGIDSILNVSTYAESESLQRSRKWSKLIFFLEPRLYHTLLAHQLVSTCLRGRTLSKHYSFFYL